MRPILALLALLICGLSAAGLAADTSPSMPTIPGPAQPPGPPPPPPGGAIPPPLPAPQPAETPEWFYGQNGQALGPFTVSYLRDLAARNELSVDTPVWKQGMAAWARLGDVAELASVVAAIPGNANKGNQPPPPPDTQALLNDAARKFLLGTWRYDGPITQGNITAYVRIEITYRPDGSYAGTQMIQMPPMGGVQPPPQTVGRSGRYSITAIDQQQFVLTMNEVGSPPAQISLKIVDQNTVEDTSNQLRSFRVR